MLAVYAIADAARAPAATGVGGERLRLYREGSIAAVAGQVRRPLAASPDNLRRYDGTMRRLAASLPALLPVRFGTCVADADELRLILRLRRRSLAHALARVRRRVQMTMRVAAGAAASGHHGSSKRPSERRGDIRSTKRRISGARYLQERAEAAARAREFPGLSPLRAALKRWVRDERIERHGTIASVYHLIPRAAAAAYQRAAARAATAAGLHILVTGPWPPYAFAVSW